MATAVGRLKQRSEFLRVAAARRKWAAPGLVLQACERPDDDGAGAPRVGFTATRKIGGAVERNRARRRLRAAAAAVLPLRGAPGCDYVIVAREGTLHRPFAALVDDLATAVARVARRRTPAVQAREPSVVAGEREGS